MQPVPHERLSQGDAERLRARRVVGSIQDQQRFAFDDLQPPRRTQFHERLTNHIDLEGLAKQCLHRNQPRCGIPRGVLTEQRNEEVVVGGVQAANAERLSSHRLQPVVDLPIAELDPQVGVNFGGMRLQNGEDLGVLLSHDRDPLRLDDPGLLARDVSQRWPQFRDVIHPDRADHGDIGSDQVRRVPGATHPDLEDPEPHGQIGEIQERQGGQRLEVRDGGLRPGVHKIEVGRQPFPLVGELLLRDQVAADADALPHGHQMRRHVEARSHPVRARESGGGSGRRGLPVRAGDVDGWVGELGIVQVAGERPHTIERRPGHVLGLTYIQERLRLAEPHRALTPPLARAR